MNLSDEAATGVVKTPKLLDIDTVSKAIGTPVNTLRYWRQKGEGPRSARLGRRVVYRETDVIAWINAQFEVAP